MDTKIAIHWFRQDLRLSDNPAFAEAGNMCGVLPIYILDEVNAGRYAMGEASRWWLHHSLCSLNKSLKGKLSVYQGNPLDIFKDIMRRFDVRAIVWNRCYEPWRINRDKKIKEFFKAQGIYIQTTNGSLLWEPWTIKKKDGTPYRVFTPFYRKGCLQAESPRKPQSIPEKTKLLRDKKGDIGIQGLSLLPKNIWHLKLSQHWKIGEDGANKKLDEFIVKGLLSYKDGRNFPSKQNVSGLSPHLHFGEISPNQVWHAMLNAGNNKNIDHFCSELGWREFSYSQLYYNPELPIRNLQRRFDAFPWVENQESLRAWQTGNTGVPMVDAGMRQLWNTGYMHNRSRMVVGSFLVKNLLIHWHHGERWFWDTLVDADLANNSAGWQWIAGCGADAAPYFRIFNPVTQGIKFDSDGKYIRKYIPEIAALPDKYIFNPWETPEGVLQENKVRLGKTYPFPIIDLKRSRALALESFQTLRKF
ncbi:MAG: deoxyribodipyrimidine photolyase [Alphaproteobacteria bacterium]|nr:deoxyribodipyrimidine photolyase [Alphaproteobacteria bacterium]|tara:strand:+ start:358 stop:1776 length:1419 start_codon:yes stop_codon:yes gene_type:complete